MNIAMPLSASRTQAWKAFVLVLMVGLLLRVGLWVAYAPVPYGDSPSYRRLSVQLQQSWDSYDGTRTPGYPVFLALTGNDQQVWLVQMGLGLMTTLLLFYLGWQISGKAWFGLAAGLAHTLNLGQLFFEANLLSETLTTFLIIAAVSGVSVWLQRPDLRDGWVAVLAAGLVGLLAGAALLVRPLFIYLPFWLALFLMFDWKAAPEGQAGAKKRFHLPVSFSPQVAVASLAPAALLLAVWVGFIHSHYGDWSLTTMTGYHLIQHTGGYFEYVPDEYAELRDTYLEYRQVQISEHGSQTNTIWGAIPAMQRVSGKSFYDLSRLLARISIQLIREHPELYLQNVVKGWWYFWRVPVYWSAEAFRWQALAGPMPALILFERLGLFAANLLFIFTSLLAVFWPLLRRRLQIPAILWCIAGLVWGASVLQSLLDHGDNPRFLVPLQSLVVLWSLWILWKGFSLVKTRANNLEQP